MKLRYSLILMETLSNMFDVDKVYGFFYSLNPQGTSLNKSSMNYKQGRDNLKLDVMRAIMESKSSTRSFLQPGGFETLKTNNRIINEAKVAKGQRNLKLDGKDYTQDINPIEPSSWIDVASQMMTGKALIGVAANANGAHAIFQHAAELRLVQGFEFDSQVYDDFTGTKVGKTEKLRTKNISETLAAFVDNGKDPQAKFSNINNYTIDVAMAMLLAGVNLDTVQFFLSQPIIEQFVQDYLNLGSNIRAERIAKKKYSELLDVKNGFNFNLDTLKITSFNTSDLKMKLTDYGDTVRQTQLLETFFSYKVLARPVSNLISAVKVGEAGLGPSDSDNLYRLDTLDENNFEGIYGAKELLDRIDLFPYHFTEVIRKGRELIVGKFDEDGNRIGKLRLPDRNRGAFAILRTMFRDYKLFTNLTVKNIEFINKNYLDYLATATDFFKFDQKLIKTLPERLIKAKKLDKYSNFLNRLNLDVDKANNITYIVYTGVNDQDKHIIDRIRDSWEAMFVDSTPIEKGYTMSDLAYDLVKYSFMISGFRITPQSFSHLQPANFYFDYLRQFDNIMETIITAVEKVDSVDSISDQFYRSAVTNFYHQFIRNHYRSLTFIPAADIENKTNIEKYNIDKNKINWITVSNESVDMLDKGRNFVDYIKATYNYNTQLFKLDNIVSQGAVKSYAIYKPVEPLGTYKKKDKAGLTSGKMFTQYDYNNALPSFKFKQNNVSPSDVKPKDLSKDSGLTEDNPLNDKCNQDGM